MFDIPKTTAAAVLPTFGIPSTTTASTSAATPSLNFGFGSSPGLGSSLTLGGAATTTTPAGFSLGISTTTTALPSFGLSTTSAASAQPAVVATTTSSTGLSLPSTSITTTTPAIPTFSLGAPVPVSTAVATSAPTATTTSVITTAPAINFNQLEDSINKWTVELQEQEQVFLNQVAQVREWDRQLLNNGDKIISLDDKLQKVKLKQQQLDHELDFIVAQQKELEECLQPLEKAFAEIAINDPERDPIYERAENVNAQLERISGELKSIIEHINEKNKAQDNNDPIAQIGRILNAHMNSLQWVDQNTSQIQQMLDQIGKLREAHRREIDSTQNL